MGPRGKKRRKKRPLPELAAGGLSSPRARWLGPGTCEEPVPSSAPADGRRIRVAAAAGHSVGEIMDANGAAVANRVTPSTDGWGMSPHRLAVCKWLAVGRRRRRRRAVQAEPVGWWTGRVAGGGRHSHQQTGKLGDSESLAQSLETHPSKARVFLSSFRKFVDEKAETGR